MNIEKLAKQRTRQQARYRVNFEPDYEHEVWSSDAAPTLQSHPDAFYQSRELVNPRPRKVTTRKKPYETLSIGALKKRVYQAGIHGSRAAALAREIHTGPSLEVMQADGFKVRFLMQ